MCSPSARATAYQVSLHPLFKLDEYFRPAMTMLSPTRPWQGDCRDSGHYCQSIVWTEVQHWEQTIKFLAAPAPRSSGLHYEVPSTAPAAWTSSATDATNLSN
eukprot:3510326-Amphidinium_carterae.1